MVISLDVKNVEKRVFYEKIKKNLKNKKRWQIKKIIQNK